MGTALGPKYIPYSYMEPLGYRPKPEGKRLILTSVLDVLLKGQLLAISG